MADLHLSQVGFFKPILDKLKHEKVDVQRLIHLCGLDKFRLDNHNNYVPLQSMYSLFELICKREGIKNLADSFVNSIQLANISEVGQFLVNTQDFLETVQRGIYHTHKITTHERLELEINGSESRLNVRWIDKPAQGRNQADQVNLAIILSGFSLAGGEDWAPLEIHYQTDSEPDLDALLPAGYKTKIKVNQPVSAIVFPTEMLSLPMFAKNSHAGLTQDCSDIPLNLGSKIMQLLESNSSEVLPSLDLIAHIADISPRTLKRRLAAEGTTFFEVIDQWRFKTALKMLSNPSTLIKEISARLGYSYVRNFDRMFNRWTSTTPQQYRENL